MARAELERNIRHIKRLLAGLLVLICAAVAYYAREFLVPVILAFFIALTFRPTIRVFARKGVPAWASATLFMTGVVAVAVLFTLLLTGPIADWIAAGPQYMSVLIGKLDMLRGYLSTLFRWTERLAGAAAPLERSAVQEVQIRDNSFYSYLTTVTGYSVALIAQIALTLVIAAFLMASGDMFYEKLIRVMPTLSDKKQALSIVYDIEREVSGYLLATTVVNAILGLAVYVGFFALGMPTPYLWGLLAFLFNYLPYLGAVAGITLSTVVSLVVFDTFAASIMPPLWYVLVNSLENQVATPWFMGRRLQMNSVAILISFAFWTWLWGVPGAILAMPLLVTFRVFCEHVEGLTVFGEFLADRQEQADPEKAEPRAAPS